MKIDLSFGSILKPLPKYRNSKGDIISVNDLPPVNCRWVKSRKYDLIQCFNAGIIEINEMESIYNISAIEFDEWLRQYEKTKTLQTTKIRNKVNAA